MNQHKILPGKTSKSSFKQDKNFLPHIGLLEPNSCQVSRWSSPVHQRPDVARCHWAVRCRPRACRWPRCWHPRWDPAAWGSSRRPPKRVDGPITTWKSGSGGVISVLSASFSNLQDWSITEIALLAGSASISKRKLANCPSNRLYGVPLPLIH